MRSGRALSWPARAEVAERRHSTSSSSCAADLCSCRKLVGMLIVQAQSLLEMRHANTQSWKRVNVLSQHVKGPGRYLQ